MNKRFISPLPTGGLPISNEDFLMLQNETLEAISAVCAGISNAFVISGCEVIPQQSYNEISAGIVFINGQIMQFDGTSTQNGTVYIFADAGTKTTRLFKDGFVKDATITTKAIANTTPPQNAPYITISTSGETKGIKEVIYSALKTNVDANTTSVATKLTDLSTAWQTTDAGGLQFRKDAEGRLEFKGSWNKPSMSDVDGTSIPMCTLPVGYRPSVIRNIIVMGVNNAYVPAWATIDINGDIRAASKAGADEFSPNTYYSSYSFDGIIVHL